MAATIANNVANDSYAKYEDFDNLSYNCIKYLIDNNETIWKLLKFVTPDAWDDTVHLNLTQQEKGQLIYDGSDDESLFKVFLDVGQPDVFTREDCIIRISPYSLYSDNRTYGTASMMFEVYSNSHINTLSNYKTRVDMVIKNFLGTFNGAIISGIGRLYFDRTGDVSSRSIGRVETAGQLPFKGKWLLMSNKLP